MFVSNNTAGSTEVSEIYGELLVPVTSKLNLELGYRYSDYDTRRAASTRQDAVRLVRNRQHPRARRLSRWRRARRTRRSCSRARRLLVVPFAPSDPCSYSTSIPWGNTGPNSANVHNAPDNPRRLEVQALCAAIINNSDAIAGNDNTSAFGTTGQHEPRTVSCGPVRRSSRSRTRSNAAIRTSAPEEAKTWTLGVVITGPGGLENLTASFDFYNIEITDAIATLELDVRLRKCFNADGVSNPTYVATTIRAATAG